MQIVPSIDIINGQSVRLLRGDYGEKKTYSVSPKEVAQQYFGKGARSLHIVDLDGARLGAVENWPTLEEILTQGGAEIQVGGGVRTETEIRRLLEFGATRVVLGSVAVKSPDLLARFAKQFGAERLCVSLDLKGNRIAYQGWLKSSSMSLDEVMKKVEESGIQHLLSTDISKDGTLEGPNIDLYTSLVRRFPNVHWFASGGVRSAGDIIKLKGVGVAGAIVGKALFEGEVRLEDLLEAAC